MELNFESLKVSGYTSGRLIAARVGEGYLVIETITQSMAFVPLVLAPNVTGEAIDHDTESSMVCDRVISLKSSQEPLNVRLSPYGKVHALGHDDHDEYTTACGRLVDLESLQVALCDASMPVTCNSCRKVQS